MNERIKIIRQHYNLSQEKFGAQIGLKKPAISLMENGKCNVTEQSFRSICKEFNVNPEWLKTGNGNMIIPSDPIQALAEEYKLNPDEILLIRKFVNLPDSSRKVIINFLYDISITLKEREAEQVKIRASNIDIDAEVAEYRAKLEAQIKAANSLQQKISNHDCDC